VLGTDAENTYCPHDGALLIKRRGYVILENNLTEGKCPKCSSKIPGIWSHHERTS
jgi:pyruvate formate lyase activating enzyme